MAWGGNSGPRDQKLRPPPEAEHNFGNRASVKIPVLRDRKLQAGAETPPPWTGNSGPHQGLSTLSVLSLLLLFGADASEEFLNYPVLLNTKLIHPHVVN